MTRFLGTRSLRLAAFAALVLLSLAPPRASAATVSDSAGIAAPGPLRVAAPTTAAAALAELAAQYERGGGRHVDVVVDATETLARRIEGGEAFDVFFASDGVPLARLVKEGLAISGSRVRYARGVLVLWSARPGRDLRGPDALHALGQKHLAIPDRTLSPYGEAAIQTLQALGLEDRLRPRIRWARNGAAAMQQVRAHEAELGFVALAQIRALPAAAQGSLWIVPEPLHRPIMHEAVALSASRDSLAARDFLAYATGPQGRSILSRYGFDPGGLSDPPAPTGAPQKPEPPAKQK